jgi:uncharacterized protein (TIGR03437 family)
MATDRRAYPRLLLIIPITAFLLLPACIRRTALTPPARPFAASAGEAEGEGHSTNRRETRKQYWARINAYKQAAARTRAFRARLGMKESAAIQSGPQTGPNPFTWTFLGPQPILTSDASNPFSGSIRDLVLDPHNSSVMYALTYLGKIWKTSDSGQSWAPLLDFSPVTVVDTLVADPIRPNTLYAENGDLFQSTDGGQTWNTLAAVVQDAEQDCQSFAFAVSPAGTAWLALEICASTPSLSGLYRSTDGGVTWAMVLGSAGLGNALGAPVDWLYLGDAAYFLVDLRFNPGNANYAYIAATTDTGAAAYVSMDQGATWTNVSPVAQFKAVEIHVVPSPSSPNTLFLLAGTSTPGVSFSFTNLLFKSTDEGASWRQESSLPPDPGSPRNPSLLAVHPTDSTLLFFGSVNLFRSQDGGDTWQSVMTAASGSTLHTDQHSLVFTADAKRLYEVSDGGIWTATKPYDPKIDWLSLNSGLGTAEIYSPIAVDAENQYHALAGTQDNGTLLLCCSSQAVWMQAGVCGDGFGTAISPTNSAITYASCNGALLMSSDSGAPGSWHPLTSGLPTLPGGDFPAIALDYSDPNVIYAAAEDDNELYQSLDGGSSWHICGTSLGNITQIQVSPSNSNVVYVTSWPGVQLSVTTNARSSNPTWASYAVPSGYRPLGLAVDYSDPSSVAVLSLAGNPGTYLFSKSSDGGATWQSVPVGYSQGSAGVEYGLGTATGGFRSNSFLASDPDIPNTFYLVKDLSVYRSSDGGQTWYPLAAGLPLVPGSGVSVHHGSRTLWAATFGRGIWNLSVPLTAPRLTTVALQPDTSATPALLMVTGENFDTNSSVQINGQSVPTTFVNANELDASVPAPAFPSSGIYYISVYKPGNAGGVSDPKQLAVGPLVFDGGLVSSANPLSTQLVPGAIMSLYGADLAPSAMSAGLPLPATLNEVQVFVNDVPAPLLYVSPGQINFIVPWEVAGQTQATIVAQNGSVQAPPVQAQVAAVSPAVFTLNQQGDGQGAVLIASPANTAIIAAPTGTYPGSRPAKRGEYIQIYATGLGTVVQPPVDGQGADGPDLTTQDFHVDWSCEGGGTPVCAGDDPTYVGLAPGFPGLYQINVQVPSFADTGNAVRLVIYQQSLSAGSNQFTIAIE